MKRILVGFSFLIHFVCASSQNLTVTGRVTDMKTREPVDFASVYFANTTTGTYTDKNGRFTLISNQDRALLLVVSHVSYQTVSVNLRSQNDSLELLINLQAKVSELKTIQVSSKDPNRKAKIESFTKSLIGESRNSRQCKLKNSEVLHLIGKDAYNMKVSADSDLIITNKALAYEISYSLAQFKLHSNHLEYYGYIFYKDLMLSSKNPKQILENRNITYEGSKMHFFRSLFANRLQEEGFVIHKMNQIPRENSDQKYTGLLADSIFIGKPNTLLVQTSEPLDIYQYISIDSVSGLKKLTFEEPFEIQYVKRKEENRYENYSSYFSGMNRSGKAQITIVKLKNSIRFDSSGSFERPNDLSTIGYWSYKKLADLLPISFNPGN